MKENNKFNNLPVHPLFCYTQDDLKYVVEYFINENFGYSKPVEDYMKILTAEKYGRYFKRIDTDCFDDRRVVSYYHVKETDFSHNNPDDNITTYELIEQDAKKHCYYKGICTRKDFRWNEVLSIDKKEFDKAFKKVKWDEDFDMEFKDDAERYNELMQMHEEASRWPVCIVTGFVLGDKQPTLTFLAPEDYFGKSEKYILEKVRMNLNEEA